MFHYRNIFTISLIAAGLFMSESNCFAADDAAAVYDVDHAEIFVTSDSPIFTLRLKSNPSTGYSWSVADVNNDVIALVRHSYQAPDTKLVGAPGFELWTFRVKPDAFVKPISTSIKLIYARPWEKGKIAESVIFKVVSAQNQ